MQKSKPVMFHQKSRNTTLCSLSNNYALTEFIVNFLIEKPEPNDSDVILSSLK